MADLTEDQISELLAHLLRRAGGEMFLADRTAGAGYTDPAVVVGLIERFNIVPMRNEEGTRWCASSFLLSAAGEDRTCYAPTLPRAVALAAIRYLEQSR